MTRPICDLPEVYQVAEDPLPLRDSTPCWPLPLALRHLLHRHQEVTMAEEGHVIDRHVLKVVGHQEHLHHSFVGIK